MTSESQDCWRLFGALPQERLEALRRVVIQRVQLLDERDQERLQGVLSRTSFCENAALPPRMAEAYVVTCIAFVIRTIISLSAVAVAQLDLF